MSEFILPQKRACSVCKIGKVESQFYQRKTGSKYPFYQCIECKRKLALEYRIKNTEMLREKQNIYASLHREQERIRARDWAIKNPDKVSAMHKAWANNNPGAHAMYAKKYRTTPASKEIQRAAVRNRRARVRGAEGCHTKIDILRIGLLQGWQCVYCRVKIKTGYHADHIIPIAKGGRNDWHNIQLLCASCNMKKNAKWPHEFAQQNGFLL